MSECHDFLFVPSSFYFTSELWAADVYTWACGHVHMQTYMQTDTQGHVKENHQPVKQNWTEI